MHRIPLQFLMLTIVTSVLISCSVLQPDAPVPLPSSEPDQNTMQAHARLKKLSSADVLIRIDNALLSAEITQQLQQQAAQPDQFEIEEVALVFTDQAVELTSHLSFRDETGSRLHAVATGEIHLEVSGDGIEWFPAYDHLEVASNELIFAASGESSYLSPLDRQRIQQINIELNSKLSQSNINHIELNPVPLGELEVGTSLLSFDNATAIKSAALKGMFFVTNSAMLIEDTETSILLDLRFVPDLAVCPADIHISRALFSRDIESREPVDITRNFDNVDDMRIFYSEVSGVTRDMSIIHYWFADGQPVVVEELPVGPSERWRTWSSRGSSAIDADHWQVLVVEKESGCILHSQSLRTTNPEREVDLNEIDQSMGDFSAYQSAFEFKAKGFPATTEHSASTSIAVRRAFLEQVFQSAMADIQIETSFKQTELTSQSYKADILPFEVADFVCENQKCANPMVCTINVAHCKRQRDTRECSSCLFRNPLNNRCLQTADDPICVAVKKRQNAIFQKSHKACIAAAQDAQNECQQLSNQITQSCEIETTVEKSVCESGKSEILSLGPGSKLAAVKAESSINGQLSTLFSNFRLAGGFKQLQQNVTLRSNLSIEGQLSFNTINADGLLSGCINAWSGPFTNRIVSSTPLNSMLNQLDDRNGTFTATWSGMVLPLEMTSSPLESALLRNPQLLAACSLGLSVDNVAQVTVGQNAGFFAGGFNLTIQPLPTKIKLDKARMKLSARELEGDANINDEFIIYGLK